MNDVQTADILLRSKLGMWQSRRTGMWSEILPYESAKFGDSRTHLIRYCTGSYRTIREYTTTVDKVNEILIELLHADYTLIRPKYPELQKFFRNGQLVTLSDQIVEAFGDINTQPQKPVDSMAAVLNSLI